MLKYSSYGQITKPTPVKFDLSDVVGSGDVTGTSPVVKLQDPGHPCATTHSQTSDRIIVVKESSNVGTTCVKLHESNASDVHRLGSRSIVAHSCRL